MTKTVRIATRGSKLALWQAHHVRDRLIETLPDLSVELVVLKTRGDKILDVALSKVGGKALFVKEIEEALLDGRADVAVHSMKDVPAELAPGLRMSAVSAREDVRDAWISTSGASISDLPAGAVVGTSSLRRQCQILARRPDLKIAMLRGNVPTRLDKLDAGLFDAIVLAAAGLIRLGFSARITELLSVDDFVPAVGQGALGIETREDDDETTALVHRALHHAMDAQRVAAERAFLAELEGGCQTPMAAYAEYRDGELHLRALIGRPDGSTMIRGERSGSSADAAQMGVDLARELSERGGAEILAECAAGNSSTPPEVQ